ncbi:MAG: hypothetical protein IPK80_25540 [Nannocystis sp.]|nr:hypothetical protein [Nannocystis sp.]
MPRLPPQFTELIASLELPLDDDFVEPLAEFSAAELVLIARQAVNLLGRGWGAAMVELGAPRAAIPAPITAERLAATPGFSDLLAGTRELSPGERDGALIGQIQGGLQALAGRSAGAPAALTLPRWGADGVFGGEMLAGSAGLRELGGYAVENPYVFAQADARALIDLLAGRPAPDLFAAPLRGEVSAPPQGAGPVGRIVAIAEGIAGALEQPFVIEVGGARYSYKARDFGVEPAFNGMLRAPGGIGYSVRSGRDYWKCNIFGGVVLALAEVPVPTHSVGNFRHFPRAERFGEALARSRGWKMIARLDHRDPANTEVAVTGEAQNEEIRALLRQIQPGDVFFADNPGPPGHDGGHTRICVEAAAPGDPDLAPIFAQARYDCALVQRDGVARLCHGRQIQFWLLRYVG